jgi:hypothetical protein
MMALDASKRDVCRMRRERTSSPLQAFVLMNGPQFVEAARALAQLLIDKHGDDTPQIINEMFRRLTSRSPRHAEVEILMNLYDRQLTYFQADAGRAEKYLAAGDSLTNGHIDAAHLAAVSAVANTLLNFDESVMKR